MLVCSGFCCQLTTGEVSPAGEGKELLYEIWMTFFFTAFTEEVICVSLFVGKITSPNLLRRSNMGHERPGRPVQHSQELHFFLLTLVEVSAVSEFLSVNRMTSPVLKLQSFKQHKSSIFLDKPDFPKPPEWEALLYCSYWSETEQSSRSTLHLWKSWASEIYSVWSLYIWDVDLTWQLSDDVVVVKSEFQLWSCM